VLQQVANGKKPEMFQLPNFNVDAKLIKEAPPYLKLGPSVTEAKGY
jgi:hypothetical protein